MTIVPGAHVLDGRIQIRWDADPSAGEGLERLEERLQLLPGVAIVQVDQTAGELVVRSNKERIGAQRWLQLLGYGGRLTGSATPA